MEIHQSGHAATKCLNGVSVTLFVLLQTVLGGDVWKSVSLVMQLHNVTVELLTSHATPKQSQQSLARLDFIRSRLSFESYSDQSKDIDLVSHEIVVSDTRFTG